MTNQNVQTNRHGPQNKGCNQASADSKHYLTKINKKKTKKQQQQTTKKLPLPIYICRISV